MTEYLIFLFANCLVFGILGMGLSVQWRLAGLMNFGVVAFFAIGAYTTALLSTRGVGPYICIPVSALLACAAAYPIGLTTVKLQTDYLAIGLLAFGEIIRIGANSSPFVGGPSGIGGIPAVATVTGGGSGTILFLIIIAVFVLAILWILLRITNSPFGVSLIATKDDAIAASAIGKDVKALRVKTLMLGCFLCGIAGSLYAYFLSYISPENFDPLVTFYVWAGIIIGGRSHVGALVGVLLFMLILEGSRLLNDLGDFVAADNLAYLRLMLTGVVLIVVLRYAPNGILWKGAKALRTAEGQASGINDEK